jgi:alpha-glucosidase
LTRGTRDDCPSVLVPTAVAYQIYPRSFGLERDGIGYIPGVISRLDYQKNGAPDSLGVDAIWPSPTYPSPMQDFSYDVAAHCAAGLRFGTLQDFDRLIGEIMGRGIRIIMDLVLNHTSDRHDWPPYFDIEWTGSTGSTS